MIFSSLKKRLRKTSNFLITKAVLKDIDIMEPKKTIFQKFSDGVKKASLSVKAFLDEKLDREQEQSIMDTQEILGKVSFKNSLTERNHYSPSIITYEEYLKNKQSAKNNTINIKKHDGWFSSDFMIKQVEARNFESVDKRFASSKISESNGNILHVLDYQPELEMLKILGYLSSDEETLYPMLKKGDLLKITSKIWKFKQDINQGLFSHLRGGPFALPQYTLSGIKTIQEEERAKNYIPLFRDLDEGDVVMFLGFKKFEDKTEITDTNVFQEFFGKIKSKKENASLLTDTIFVIKKSFIAEWIVDDKVITAILPISSLEKIENEPQ